MHHRHAARIMLIQILYQWDFRGQVTALLPAIQAQILAETLEERDYDEAYIDQCIAGFIEHQEKIETQIELHANRRHIAQMDIIDRNILRLATYELLYTEDIPAKVIVNEAIELAKRFGNDASTKFINGILGAMYEQIAQA